MFRLFRRNRGERLPIQSCRKYRTKDGAVSQVANKGEGNNTRSGRHHTSSTYGRLWPRMDSHLFAVREFSRGHAQSRLPESQLEPRIREVCAGRVLAQAKLRRTPFPVYVTRSASGFCGLLLSSVRKCVAGDTCHGLPSPDGRHLAIIGRDQSNNMWMIENF